jgi:transposase
MRRIKEVLRLRFELGLGQRQIARSCSIGLGTVHEYLQRAEAAGVGWPLPEGWDQTQLEAALFGSPPRRGRPPPCPLPDFAALHEQRQRHPHLTLQLLWEEYRQANPDGYRYSRFCELYRRWQRQRDVVLRQEHKAGEKLFVDWAGATIPLYDPQGGPPQAAHLFVAVMGLSSYTYAEATRDEQLASWIGAHVRAFEFFGGVTKLVIPDNTRTGVARACRYDPDLNPTYQEMAMHYGVGVAPTRPYKPRDKAKAEAGVLLVERWIVAALRHRKFFSWGELNQSLRELLERLNQRPFRKREGSRESLFLALDRPALKTLPAERFDLSQWSRARVNIDYHIAFDSHFYSVPYNLAHELVEVRSTPTTVETAQLFERILADKPHPEMGYRSCLGLIRLAQQYSPARLEAAAERALLTGACRYQSVKSILKNSLDAQPLAQSSAPAPSPPHDNIRGAAYFD